LRNTEQGFYLILSGKSKGIETSVADPDPGSGAFSPWIRDPDLGLIFSRSRIFLTITKTTVRLYS
jgi:hypothetical protein